MLDVQNLCKSFGKQPSLTGLTFDVAAGECLALLGRNGSGKTLLLNLLATLVEPTSGTLSIDDCDAFRNLKKVRPLIGYVPAAFEGYPELSGENYLNFFASAYRLARDERTASIDAVLELMDIGHLRDRKTGTLSIGERQRLLFAKTFLHEPQLWLLDEPLAPLDARGQIEMIQLLGELRAMGKSIVIATNRLEDVPKMCNKVGILNNGQLVVFNTLTQLQQEFMETENRSNWLVELFLEVTNP